MEPKSTIAMVIVLFSCLVSHIAAQVQRQDCMNRLQPCLNYLNGNQRPPESCCRPLDYIIRSMPECLCSMMTIRGSNQAEMSGINVTEAQTLPARCGQHINPLGCITGTPDMRSRNSVPNSGSSVVKYPSSIPMAVILLIILTL